MRKKKDANLGDRGTIRFQVGLMLALLMVYLALEWKSIEEKRERVIAMDESVLLDETVPITRRELPPPPPPVTPNVIDLVPDDDDVEETVIASSEPDPDTEILDASDIRVEEVLPDEVIPFIAVEEAPIFPGCEAASDKRTCFNEMMQKHIRANFRYPESAIDIGVQGRVSVMFTIQKDGSIGNIRLRGPDRILEAESLRIIEKLPRMTPGRQQGRAVRVPFSIPIMFKLQ